MEKKPIYSDPLPDWVLCELRRVRGDRKDLKDVFNVLRLTKGSRQTLEADYENMVIIIKEVVVKGPPYPEE